MKSPEIAILVLVIAVTCIVTVALAIEEDVEGRGGNSVSSLLSISSGVPRRRLQMHRHRNLSANDFDADIDASKQRQRFLGKKKKKKKNMVQSGKKKKKKTNNQKIEQKKTEQRKKRNFDWGGWHGNDWKGCICDDEEWNRDRLLKDEPDEDSTQSRDVEAPEFQSLDLDGKSTALAEKIVESMKDIEPESLTMLYWRKGNSNSKSSKSKSSKSKSTKGCSCEQSPSGTAPPTSRSTPNPTQKPTTPPTDIPTAGPTTSPTPQPTNDPTNIPTAGPTTRPTPQPTNDPTDAPTKSAGSISGIVYEDKNNNGVIDEGEGMADRKVELLLYAESSTNSGRELQLQVIQEVLSNEDGKYKFDVATVGDYQIRFVLDVTKGEHECCSPSRAGPNSSNSILYGGSQCAPSYETGVIKVIDGSNEITDVNGGIVCGQCRGDWKIVVNNADPIPDAEGFQGKNFSSYNAASVNMGAFVVFRARSTGGGNPSTGIFVRDMLSETSGIVRQAGRRTTVPGPNNLNTTFFEFPSFPRMSISSYHIATRGNHGPVLQYEIDDENTTKVGNTGLYFNLVAENDIETDSTSPNLQTGMAKLGSVPEYSIYEVPGLDKVYAGTVFDVFPGSPAIEDDGIIGFKGNYAKGNESQTGVFYRQLVQQVGGGDGKVFVVANSDTEIPPPIEECQTKTFGSTSPPSIANSKMVFIGLDVEEDPKCGAIYQAEMHSSNFPELKTLVNFQTLVPGEDNQKFTRFGEGISYDGNAVSFWGGWGDEFETILLCCPATGNEDRRSFCLYNDTNTIYDPETAPEGCDSGRYQTKTVPVNQGIFVYNEVSGSVETVAKGSTKEGTDFIFWNYSGKPPGAGGSHSGDPSTTRRRRLDGAADESDAAEVPRWRASATVALSSYNSVAFKKKQNDVVGIYHWEQLDGYNIDSTIVETGVKCTTFDPLAVSSVDGTPLEVESVAMERDSFRGTRLVVSIACAAEEADESDIGDDDDGDGEDVEADWGGIYMTRWCTEGSRPIGY